MKLSVPICGYGDPRHTNTACFVDYVRALVSALRSLGHEVVPPTTDGHTVDSTARPIVFGAQNMASIDDPRDPGSFCPPNAILYNSEQTGARGMDPKRIFDAVRTWRKRVVWDYSEENAKVLRAMGCEHVIHCPVAYDPVMTRIRPLPPEQEDIDVLFYGAVATPRNIEAMRRQNIRLLDRGKILTDLQLAGLKVVHLVGVYAEAVDPYVARAKVVLNLHYYEGAVFEIFRCSQLFANTKCVVTEDGGCDDTLESFAKRATIYVSRKNIVEACRTMVADRSARIAQAERGFNAFKETSLANNVRMALERS